MRALTPSRRVFEPGAVGEEPLLPPSPRSFAERQVGLLVHQGHLERARVYLARRAAAEPLSAPVYLDGMRMELTVQVEGDAWGGWLLRGLRAGAAVLDELQSVVPRRLLANWLPGIELRWRWLARQPARAVAIDLLRIHLAGLLLGDRDREALAVLQQHELSADAAQSGELRALVAGALTVLAWRDHAAAAELAARFDLCLIQQPVLQEPASDAVALLSQVTALAPALSACGRLPPGLVRALRLCLVVERSDAAELLRRLPRELAARADEHESGCDAMAAQPALCDFFVALLGAALAELELEPRALPRDELEQLERRLRDACNVTSRGLRGWLAQRGPLKDALAPRVYVETLRPRLVRALLHHRCTRAQLLASAGARLPATLRTRLHADRGLQLLGALASLPELPAPVSRRP